MQLQKKIKNLLPNIQQGLLSKMEVEALINELHLAIKQNPAQGKKLGRLIPLINQAVKSQVQIPEINWVPVGNGALAIGHKPGGKIPFKGMKSAGVTAVLTLLQEKEGACAIGAALERANVGWIWFPFSAAKPYGEKVVQDIFALFGKVEEALKAGAKIYIHCSAGIHRTGMITYGLLRYLGQERETALQNLEKLRKVTAEQATAERLQWGDQFGDK